MSQDLDVVGKPTPRIDALERVTGRAKYTWDVQLPGMLYARILRSPHPHAHIRHIDTSRAERLPGVHAVITGADANPRWRSGDSEHERMIFNNPVRYAGEPVAVVAAVDRHVAEDALELIDVDYEILPFVLDARSALEGDAPQVHDAGNVSANSPTVSQRGSLEEGFAAADHIVEASYSSAYSNNAQMEPRAAIAHWEGRNLTVWTTTQGVSNARRDIANDLGLPQSNVRVICQYVGGGFGNKNQAQDYDLMVALLAKQTGRPVKLEYTRHDDFIGLHGRWSTEMQYRMGAKSDGTLTAIDFRGVSNMGAYMKSNGNITSFDLYTCPNTRAEITRVFTNRVTSANQRAPSYPQGYFAMEQTVDQMAHELGLDPLEMRLKNRTLLYQDRTPYTSNAMEACLREGAELFKWRESWRPPNSDPGPLKHGVGLGMGSYTAPLGLGSAIIRVNTDASVQVLVGVVDIGTGAKTTMGMIAAEALGVSWSRIVVENGDTTTTPFSIGESSSRTTVMTGWAVKVAADSARGQILELAAPLLEVTPEELTIRQDRVLVKADPTQTLALTAVLRRAPEAIIGTATTNPQLEGQARVSFCADFAEVEVDTRTGLVRVLRYVAAHDSGQIISPMTAESQVQGGVHMGLGQALFEEMSWERRTGRPVKMGYHYAQVLTHLESPPVRVHFVDNVDPYGPYGAKVVGEPPITAVCGTVANAIFNATGARVRELPMTPDRVLAALGEVRS
jgi:xanthine dehydrogenase YagR molybdenum-binding subunit